MGTKIRKIEQNTKKKTFFFVVLLPILSTPLLLVLLDSVLKSGFGNLQGLLDLTLQDLT